MGERNGTLYYSDGQPVGAPLPDFSICCGTRKHFHCKSRKRFIKLLMGNGYSRNDANYLARYAQKKERPYQSVWNWMIYERPRKKGR